MVAGILLFIAKYGGMIAETAKIKDIRVEKIEKITSRSKRRIEVASDPLLCLA